MHHRVDAVQAQQVGQSERIGDIHPHRDDPRDGGFAQVAAEDDVDVGVVDQQIGDPGAEEAGTAGDQDAPHRRASFSTRTARR